MIPRLFGRRPAKQPIEEGLEELRRWMANIDGRLYAIDWKIGQFVPHPIPCERQAAILAALRPLTPQRALKASKKRIGSANDGGYIMLDDFDGIIAAVSLGIADNAAWDLNLAEKGIPVDQFDGSIDFAPLTHPNLHFHKLMISGLPRKDHATLADAVSKHPSAGNADMILKIDIEGHEWEVFDSIDQDTLRRFS